jgi:hypothetical protein
VAEAECGEIGRGGPKTLAAVLQQFLCDEEIADSQGDDGDGDVRDEDADSWKIVAQLAVSAQLAIFHLQHLLILVRMRSRDAAVGCPRWAIRYPTEY